MRTWCCCLMLFSCCCDCDRHKERDATRRIRLRECACLTPPHLLHSPTCLEALTEQRTVQLVKRLTRAHCTAGCVSRALNLQGLHRSCSMSRLGQSKRDACAVSNSRRRDMHRAAENGADADMKARARAPQGPLDPPMSHEVRL